MIRLALAAAVIVAELIAIVWFALSVLQARP